MGLFFLWESMFSICVTVLAADKLIFDCCWYAYAACLTLVEINAYKNLLFQQVIGGDANNGGQIYALVKTPIKNKMYKSALRSSG